MSGLLCHIQHGRFVLAMTAGADYFATAVSEYTVFNENGSPTTYDRTNAVREGASFMFFSVLFVFTILGLMLAVIGRGVFIQPSERMVFLRRVVDGKYNRQSIPLQVALGVWMGAHIASMWFMNSVSDADRLGIPRGWIPRLHRILAPSLPESSLS